MPQLDLKNFDFLKISSENELQSNLVIRNGLIRYKLVLRNHFLSDQFALYFIRIILRFF